MPSKIKNGKKKIIALGIACMSLVGVAALAIPLAVCKRHSKPPKPDSDSDYFAVHNNYDVEIYNDQGAKLAITYCLEHAGEEYEVSDNGFWPWFDNSANIGVTYTDLINALSGDPNDPFFDESPEQNPDGELVLSCDAFVLFYHQQMLKYWYTNEMLWYDAIYGIAWRILCGDSTWGSINWQGNTINGAKSFSSSIPIISSDYWVWATNIYTNIEFSYNPRMTKTTNGPQPSSLSVARQPRLFEIQLLSMFGISMGAQTKFISNQEENKNINKIHFNRSPEGFLFIDGGMMWLGSGCDPWNFNFQLLQLELIQGNIYFMLDYYTIDSSIRINASSTQPPTFID